MPSTPAAGYAWRTIFSPMQPFRRCITVDDKDLFLRIMPFCSDLFRGPLYVLLRCLRTRRFLWDIFVQEQLYGRASNWCGKLERVSFHIFTDANTIPSWAVLRDPMVFCVKDTMFQRVCLGRLCRLPPDGRPNGLQASHDSFQVFSIPKRSNALDIFKDKYFWSFLSDILQNSEEYRSTILGILEALFLSSIAERLTGKSCKVQIHGWYLRDITLRDIPVQDFWWIVCSDSSANFFVGIRAEDVGE